MSNNHQQQGAKRMTNVWLRQNNGSDEQALGARMRMAFDMVGAIRSMVTWVGIRSAFVPAP